RTRNRGKPPAGRPGPCACGRISATSCASTACATLASSKKRTLHRKGRKGLAEDAEEKGRAAPNQNLPAGRAVPGDSPRFAPVRSPSRPLRILRVLCVEALFFLL